MINGSMCHPIQAPIAAINLKSPKLGVPVIDTDVIAHQIVEPGRPALIEIESVFGPGILDETGRLKRSQLRQLIFSDSQARVKLESILHPKIRNEVSKAVAKVKHDYCILVIPLLAEHGAYPNLDRILVVDVDPETQISRLMARDNSTRQQARQALASQADRQQRLDISDDVFVNSGKREEIQKAVLELNEQYLQMTKK